MSLSIARTINELRLCLSDWRRNGLTMALIPTMGALHDGHLSLVHHGLKSADRVCVTLFVNPIQFDNPDDLKRYPRNEAHDIALLEKAGVDLLFAPDMSQMYSQDEATRILIGGPALELEGVFRPDHFTGVATIVAKLLIQTQPDIAIFGEKDYQQLRVIIRMVTDLCMPVRIDSVPTIREPDGLAMSSRNIHLTPKERLQAPVLNHVLQMVAHQFREGKAPNILSDRATAKLIDTGFRSVDYIEIRDAISLARVGSFKEKRNYRVLGAAFLGKTRLIDNIPV